MLFNSYIFILFFVPLFLAGYFGFGLIPVYGKTLAQTFLLGMSLWFYGYLNYSYLFIIIASILVNYAVYRLMKRLDKNISENNPKSGSISLRKAVFVIGLLFNIGLLFYFKYFDFFLTGLNSFFHMNFVLKNIAVPLGISFFSFRQISFIVDSYRREVPDYGLLYYASFVAYFPQLIAGPIVTHDELIPQFTDDRKKKFNPDNMAAGIYMFAMGLVKKVIIADTFGIAADLGYSDVMSLTTATALVTVLSYTIQIYFDFSGYCDMAIGLGKMMNIDIAVNFDSPYKALTITDFWKRWHITLTRFFTKYVYIPLGGNRKDELRTYINIMAVFLISGLWHGAGLTFIVWGALHGLFVVITRKFKDFFEKLHPALNFAITFAFVSAAWVPFRTDNLQDALVVFKRIAKFNFTPVDEAFAEVFNLPEFVFAVDLINSITGVQINESYPFVFLELAFLITFMILLGAKNAKERMDEFDFSNGKVIGSAVLIIWCLLSMSNISTFLYLSF